MPRLLPLIAVVVFSSCEAKPEVDPGSPAASRLASKSAAVVRPELRTIPGSKHRVMMRLDGSPPSTPDVEVEPGTQLRVVDDSRPADIGARFTPDEDRAKVDWRRVRVEVLDGEHRGTVGGLFRFNIRPVQSESR